MVYIRYKKGTVFITDPSRSSVSYWLLSENVERKFS